MAMCALDAVAAGQITARVRVTGGDLSQLALAKLRAGRYTERQLADVPPSPRRRYFQLATATPRDLAPPELAKPNVFRVTETLHSTVLAQPWNLCRPETFHPEPQDIIFCQNLLIYLRRDARPELVRRLGTCLRLGGYLFLAPGEVLGLRLAGLERFDVPDCLIYQRVA
ncbi:MAG: CheR family methyltransferase, partial [Acidobacteriota bacterium]